MPQTQKIYFIPPLDQEISHYLMQTIPARRRRKVARYLQHFDLWLRNTHYKSLNHNPLPLEAYVYFYLCHISLYPGSLPPSEPRDYYLEVDIDELLIDRKLKGLGRLTSRQAASRVAAAMKWQEHRFGKILDPMRSSMKKLYTQAKYFSCVTELTAKAELNSAELFEQVNETCRGVEHWVRDLVMVSLLKETRCTTKNLAEAKCVDFFHELSDRWYFQFGMNKKIYLTQGCATLLQVLLGRHHHLEKYRVNHQQLFSMGDAGVEFKMDAHEVELVLERRYRFALMLRSVNCAPVVNLYNPGATPFPEEFVSERAAPIPPQGKTHKVINLQFTADFDKPLDLPSFSVPQDQYFYEDWDAAVRQSSLAVVEPKVVHIDKTPPGSQNTNLQHRRVLIAGESIDETAWADCGED